MESEFDLMTHADCAPEHQHHWFALGGHCACGVFYPDWATAEIERLERQMKSHREVAAASITGAERQIIVLTGQLSLRDAEIKRLKEALAYLQAWKTHIESWKPAT